VLFSSSFARDFFVIPTPLRALPPSQGPSSSRSENSRSSWLGPTSSSICVVPHEEAHPHLTGATQRMSCSKLFHWLVYPVGDRFLRSDFPCSLNGRPSPSSPFTCHEDRMGRLYRVQTALDAMTLFLLFALARVSPYETQRMGMHAHLPIAPTKKPEPSSRHFVRSPKALSAGSGRHASTATPHADRAGPSTSPLAADNTHP
jgi:hypothetical protein